MVETLKVSVLIPTWRRPDSLLRCLQALVDQTRPPDELVLVVRNDDTATREALSGADLPFPCTCLPPSAAGVVAALNTGFDRVSGEVVAITDDDTEPMSDWLERIERHFQSDSRLGALGGRDRIVNCPEEGPGDPRLPVGQVRWFGRVTGYHHLGAGPPRPADIVKGANMAVRRTALGRKRLDTDLRGTGAEHHWEIDLSLAVKRAGWRIVYDPAVEVLHHEAERFGGQREHQMSCQERFDAVHNQTLALLKNLSGPRRAIAFGYTLLVGTRADPGLLLAAEQRLRGGRGQKVKNRLEIATRARRAAFRGWRRSGSGH